MAKPDFFQRLGIFVERDFIDKKTCRLLCAEAGAVRPTPATIIRSSEYHVDKHSRRTKALILSQATTKSINQRLIFLKSKLEDHFGISLKACEGPNFLLYSEGDFFKPQ